MTTYAKTTDGKIHVVFSDNPEFYPETMDLIPKEQWLDDYGKYDPEYICCTNYLYSHILVTDTNLTIVKNFKIGE